MTAQASGKDVKKVTKHWQEIVQKTAAASGENDLKQFLTEYPVGL